MGGFFSDFEAIRTESSDQNAPRRYDLLKKEGVPYEPNTGSDCEVLIPLYVKFGLEKACSLLRGRDPRGNQI